MYFQSLF